MGARKSMVTQKHKAYLILFSMFLFGVAVGVSGYSLLFNAPAPPPARTVSVVTSELSEAVQLDPEQKMRVESLLRESKRQYDELKTAMRPQAIAIRDETRRKIRELLREDQTPRFDQYTRDLDAKREREKKAAEENNK
jgi:hypothetical protein